MGSRTGLSRRERKWHGREERSILTCDDRNLVTNNTIRLNIKQHGVYSAVQRSIQNRSKLDLSLNR